MRTLAIAPFLAVLAPIPANAAQPAAPITVTYADLDLRTDAGVRTLDRRLNRAIGTLCSQSEGRLDLHRHIGAQRCAETKTAEIAEPRSRAIAVKSARMATIAH